MLPRNGLSVNVSYYRRKSPFIVDNLLFQNVFDCPGRMLLERLVCPSDRVAVVVELSAFEDCMAGSYRIR